MLDGEDQLAGVLAGEQPGQDIREGADTAAPASITAPIATGSLIYSVLGLVIFAGFTMFDFQRLRRSRDITSAPFLAASIFLGVLTTARGVLPPGPGAGGARPGGRGCRNPLRRAARRGPRQLPGRRRARPVHRRGGGRLRHRRRHHGTGSKSHQNTQRQGFDLLYTRAILVKQP